MDKCIFCDSDLAPGSEEHVFLSALGGRIATRRATCTSCNNAFANDQTGKVDDALAQGFEEVRNGLRIWSGRDGPPPTLVRAGAMSDGTEFDLAPGFVPITRAGKLPNQLDTGTEHMLVARDEADANRLLSILAKRGVSADLRNAIKVQKKVPTVHRHISFDGPKVWRCVAKTAVVGCVVLYGNQRACALISENFRKAIRYGDPEINNYLGWDFVNKWPQTMALTPHAKTPNAKPSGFEHMLIVTDVDEHLVAYISLFGGWRFSCILGPKSNLSTRGLAVNPRSGKPARFVVEAKAPDLYLARRIDSFQKEHEAVMAGNNSAFGRAFEQWSFESREGYSLDLAAELEVDLAQAGKDEERRADAINKFAKKLAHIEMGESWETTLDTMMDEGVDGNN